ncbi:unnamed protein product [Leuciscus chuanchicus]
MAAQQRNPFSMCTCSSCDFIFTRHTKATSGPGVTLRRGACWERESVSPDSIHPNTHTHTHTHTHLLPLLEHSDPQGHRERSDRAVNNTQNDVSLLSVERSSSMRCGSPPRIWAGFTATLPPFSVCPPPPILCLEISEAECSGG